jgi:thymidylate synthase (FAD)
MKVEPRVTLLSHSPEPLRSLYLAYRVCYSQLTPQEIARRIESERITRDEMARFVEERLKTGHTSPLEQVWFEFLISGVSRAFSHQFVRHRVGVSVEQQSQRYVTYKTGRFPYVLPASVVAAGKAAEFEALMQRIGEVYEELVSAGVPGEDARFVLPNATATNLKVTITFAALLHMADLRLCTRAQWEFRHVVAKMRAEVVRVEPLLGRMLQPKCGERRLGYCDEDFEAYKACPLSRVRPHKIHLEGVQP